MSRSVQPDDLPTEARREGRRRWEYVRLMCTSTLSMIRVECTQARRKGVVRKFRGLVRLVTNFSGYVALFRIMTHPHVIELTHRHPSLLSKSLRSDYLAHSFDTRDRLHILINHYGYLKNRVRRDFLRRLHNEGHRLWQERLDDRLFGIHLDFPKEYDYEGDLRLAFKCECITIYTITFTIVPGCLVDLDGEQVLLISNVQGIAGGIDLIRQATKICYDTAPVHLLLSAAQAIALLLDVRKIAGVGHREQISVAFCKPKDNDVFFNYDQFWKNYAAEATCRGCYVVSVPFPEKPISAMKSRHRSRGLRRRELRKRIFDQASANFRQACLEAR